MTLTIFTPNRITTTLIAVIFQTFLLPSVSGQTYKKRTYANFQGVYRTGLYTLGAESVFGNITNASLAADNSPQTASAITIPLGLAGSASVTQFLEFTTDGTHSTVRTIAAGTPVAVKFKIPTSLLGLLSGIEIGTYTGLNTVSQSISGPLSFMGTGSGNAAGQNSTNRTAIYTGTTLLNALNGAGEMELLLTPSQAFNGVYIKLSGNALSLALTTEVFHAYILEDAPLNCTTMNEAIDVLSGVKGNALVNVASATGTVTSPWNAVDDDPLLNTYSTLSTGVQVLSNVFETVIFETPSEPGDSIKIVLQLPGAGLIDIALLKGFAIQPYLGNVAVGSPITSSNSLLVLDLLSGGTNKYELSAEIPVAFDRIEIMMGGVADALTDLRIYNVERVIAGPSITAGSADVTNDTVTVYSGNSFELVAASLNSEDNITWYDENGQMIGNGGSYLIESVVEEGLYYAETSRNGCAESSSRHSVYVRVLAAQSLALSDKPRLAPAGREINVGMVTVQNPVKENMMLRFAGVEKGRYTIAFSSIEGRLVYTKQLVINGDNQNENICISRYVSPGFFAVRVYNGKSFSKTFKVIVK